MVRPSDKEVPEEVKTFLTELMVAGLVTSLAITAHRDGAQNKEAILNDLISSIAALETAAEKIVEWAREISSQS